MPPCLKRLASSFPVEIVARRNGVSAVLRPGPHHDKLVGLGIRHRFEHRIDHAENGSRCAYPQRECQHRSHSEAGFFTNVRML